MILQLTIKCCHQTPTAAASPSGVSSSPAMGRGQWEMEEVSNFKPEDFCFSVGTGVLVFFSVSIKFITLPRQPWSEHSGVAQEVPHTCCSSYLRTCPEAPPLHHLQQMTLNGREAGATGESERTVADWEVVGSKVQVELSCAGIYRNTVFNLDSLIDQIWLVSDWWSVLPHQQVWLVSSVSTWFVNKRDVLLLISDALILELS